MAPHHSLEGTHRLPSPTPPHSLPYPSLQERDCTIRAYSEENGTGYHMHAFGMEVALYESLLASPYRTNHPSRADFFYVPVWAGCWLSRFSRPTPGHHALYLRLVPPHTPRGPRLASPSSQSTIPLPSRGAPFSSHKPYITPLACATPLLSQTHHNSRVSLPLVSSPLPPSLLPLPLGCSHDREITSLPRAHRASEMVRQALHNIRSAYPYFNRSGGADHIFSFPHDEGACLAPIELNKSILVSHWGRTEHHPANHTTISQGKGTLSPSPSPSHLTPHRLPPHRATRYIIPHVPPLPPHHTPPSRTSHGLFFCLSLSPTP